MSLGGQTLSAFAGLDGGSGYLKLDGFTALCDQVPRRPAALLLRRPH